MALDATVGGANANSYADETFADEYILDRANSDAWDDVDNVEAALITAARFLDALFTWTGAAATETQAMAWPRTGMLNRNGFAIASNVIPNALKYAQIELAFALSVNTEIFGDDDILRQRITSLSAGSVSLAFKQSDRDDLALALRSPELAYLSSMVPDAVKILLVPSWYEQPNINDVGRAQAEFEVLP